MNSQLKLININDNKGLKNEIKEEWDQDFEFGETEIAINNKSRISEWDEDIQKSDYTQSTLFDSFNSSKANSLRSLIDNNIDDNTTHFRHSRHISFNDEFKPSAINKKPFRRNSLSDLRIPQFVKNSQQGLKIQLGSVKEFSKGVDELKRLRDDFVLLKDKINWPSNDLPVDLQRICSKLDLYWADVWESANVLIELASGSGIVPIAEHQEGQENLPRSLTTSPANLNSLTNTTNNTLSDKQLDILKSMLQKPAISDYEESPRGSTTIGPPTGLLNDEQAFKPPTSPSTPTQIRRSRLRRASKAGLNSFKDLVNKFVNSIDSPTKLNETTNTIPHLDESNLRTPPTLHRKRPSLAQLFTRKASTSSLTRKTSLSSQRKTSMNIPPIGAVDLNDENTPIQTPTKPKRLNSEFRSYSENLSTPKQREEKINFPMSSPINRSQSTGECRLQLTPDALPQLLGHLNQVKSKCQESLSEWKDIPV
ncbi:hypothetical protein E3Q23_02411 [Wallemia mellicola]|uniref:Uncharacterized protein n=1 Tax=Wallemia mellicola TaxID=1708541 RepID=A0A4T0RYM8_9BASI|nr:hypothetical protein E3Q23_02411 [Wallemia mellicola]TIB91761.1 hypothetical protein E3Q19_02303 [Wallemia mellicola]TIC16652.1 hypothetical protein E3Q13_02887 [Wallemia mellicola]TIC40747.1 hypothetical protein E3Q08_03603 [Wallemia mellicola]TIC64374.1 hypothetical protein E3Q02_02643 [Wallemia mellicola]